METVCRRESMKLWEALVRNLPPKNSEKMPDNPRAWVFEYYKQRRGEKSIFKRWQKVCFEEEKHGNEVNGAAGRKSMKTSERQK